MGGLSHTVSGDIASFRTPSRVPIESLKFHFLPKQEGSGDPSPTNVRPITGWNGLTFFSANDNLIALSDLQYAGDPNKIECLITDNTMKIVCKRQGNGWDVASQVGTIDIPKALRGKSVCFGVEDVILETANKDYQRSTIVCEFRDENNVFITDPTIVSVMQNEDPQNPNMYSRNQTIPSNAAKLKIYFRIAQNIATYGVSVGDYIIYKNFYMRYPNDKREYTKYEGEKIPITFPDGQTIYGGYVDPVAGEIVAEWGYHVWNGTEALGTNYRNASGAFYTICGEPTCKPGSDGYVISNMLKTQSGHALENRCWKRTSEPGYLMDFTIDTFSDLTVEEFAALSDNEVMSLLKAYLADLYANGTPLVVAYKLIDPIRIPISPQAIKAFLDHNNFWSDANDITEATYPIAESKDILEARKKAFAMDNYNHGTLVFELNGDDAPVDGAWVERISNKAFILNSAASYDSVNKIYDFSNRGAAYYQFYNNDTPVIYLGHHFRIEWDVYFRREGSTNGHFFDIGSVTTADKAVGIGLISKTASAISFNWKMQGNSSNPFASSGEIRSHPNAPVSGDTNYTHFTGFHEIINGGDGYDRFRIKIGDRIIQYQTQIPQVEYGPLWQSSRRYIAVGASVYNAGKEVSAYDTGYLSDVKIKSIKIYILD